MTANSYVLNEKDLSSLFSKGGKELEKLMFDTRSIRRTQTRNINLQEKDVPGLLSRFLSELVYLSDTYQLIFSDVSVKVNEQASTLTGHLKGERFDPKRHSRRLRIKDLSPKSISLSRAGKFWHAEVFPASSD